MTSSQSGATSSTLYLCLLVFFFLSLVIGPFWPERVWEPWVHRIDEPPTNKKVHCCGGALRPLVSHSNEVVGWSLGVQWDTSRSRNVSRRKTSGTGNPTGRHHYPPFYFLGIFPGSWPPPMAENPGHIAKIDSSLVDDEKKLVYKHPFSPDNLNDLFLKGINRSWLEGSCLLGEALIWAFIISLPLPDSTLYFLLYSTSTVYKDLKTNK